MTRPDFAEMAREWLHRTTSITSASPETERAVAQELERVWQIGAEAQLSSGRGLRGPDRGPILSGVGARCSPPERKTTMNPTRPLDHVCPYCGRQHELVNDGTARAFGCAPPAQTGTSDVQMKRAEVTRRSRYGSEY